MWSASILAPLLSTSENLLKKVKSFKLDSRDVEHNDLFIAYKGQKVDGHKFIKEAQKKGAIAALVEEDFEEKEIKGLTFIRTPCVLKTLQRLAKELIKAWNPKVIAVTGSIGKTTTKEFIDTLLSPHVDLHKSYGNHNSQLTLPLTILNSPRQTKWLLLEMGMDRPGELDRLLDIAPPDYALLTYLAHVHLEPFSTFERLALEKSKIFRRQKTKLGIYPLEMPFSDLAKAWGVCPKKTTSLEHSSADYFLAKKGPKRALYFQGQHVFDFNYPLQESKSALNLLHAVALAHSIGLSFEQIRQSIESISYPTKRMSVVEHKGIYLLNDAYNACVDSVANALEALPKTAKRKVAVLSELVDQGSYSIENHQKMTLLALKQVDLLIGFGQEMQVMIPLCRKSGKKWAFFLSYAHLLHYFTHCLSSGDAVLIKGARKHALERLVYDFMAH